MKRAVAAAILSAGLVACTASAPPELSPRTTPPVASVPSDTCNSGWVIAHKPQASGVEADSLVAASGSSAADVWAVGTRFLVDAAPDETEALIEHWDGRGWRCSGSAWAAMEGS